MRRALAVGAVLASLSSLLLHAACKDDASAPGGPSVGTNSNWLRACDSDDPCGDPPECRCGACTLSCATDADCAGLADARCAEGEDLAALAECGASAASGICLPRCTPGGCDPGQACVAQACVLAPLPDVPLCDPVVDRDATQRALEEDLLDRVQALRVAGGASCSGTGAAPAPGLRFDPRLVCAARVLALDLAATRTPTTTDSQGRTTEDRLVATGYAPTLWADSFAIDTTDAPDALNLILSDAGSCTRLTDPSYTSIGVGSADGVLVVTIAAE